MSKGDELWEKREKLLKYLYDKEAIAPDDAGHDRNDQHHVHHQLVASHT